MYWRTRELLDAGGIKGLDDEMISQAAQVRFFYDLQGRVAIEPKKVAAKRGVSSPDRWESVVLTFGVEPYESLAKSLTFAMRAPVLANSQVPPTDLRDEELERERNQGIQNMGDWVHPSASPTGRDSRANQGVYQRFARVKWPPLGRPATPNAASAPSTKII